MGFLDWFSKNGKATVFLEGLPVVGYVVAAGQGIAGNTEEAKRAAIRSTNALITTAATVGGGIVAGPAGAMLGAAAGKAAGIGLEKATAGTVDPGVRMGLGEQTLASGAIEVVTSAAGGGAGGVGSALYSATAGTTGTAVGNAIGSSLASTTASTMFGGGAAVNVLADKDGGRRQEL
ncbi:hypothetical protein OBBRIDRAFT_838041 [Obba rivulosa]|uniref:Uncharacterized protein n=1 Tax=Obba rivulosa TaxID=1052685 RepID=A0A8E2ATU5_9APHY|nr:hypothetical protein OBBRIDRAFT_838041 [Obba rivulosa]